MIEDTIVETTAENTYELSKVQFEYSDMKLGKLEMHDFHETVKANGTMDVPPQNRVSVMAYFGGYVKDMQILPGEQVEKGQSLFTLENPDYVQLQQEYLEANGQLAYLKSDYKRQKNLAQDNVTSQKNYLKAEADYNVTQARFKSLQHQLTLMGLDPNAITLDNIRTTIVIKSPISGYVTQVNINKGSYLTSQDVAISLIDIEHMHLELDVFENDLAQIAVGQSIQFKIQNNSRIYQAEVYLINKSVDPEKRTIRVHGHIVDDKNTNLFAPGMYIEAEISSAGETQLSLPENALVEADGKHFVLALNSASNNGFSFSKKEVQTGISSKGFIAITNPQDFADSTEFLVSGAFNLLTE